MRTLSIALTIAFCTITYIANCQTESKLTIEKISELISLNNPANLNNYIDSVNRCKIKIKFSDEDLIKESKVEYISGDKNNAIGYAYAATLLFPESAMAYTNLGVILTWLNLITEAIQQFNKALEINNEYWEAEYQLSRLEGIQIDKNNETKINAIKDIANYNPANNEFLSLKKPGKIPELFAPGIVSSSNSLEFGCTFSPDGKEIYFTRREDGSSRNIILVSYLSKSGWTIPDTAVFSTGYSDFEPYFSKDGNSIFFGSIRSVSKGGRPISGIWLTKRIKNGWSTPTFLYKGMYISISTDNTIFLSNISGDPTEGISFKSFKSDSTFNILQGPVNNPVAGHHPCVAPDKSYLIFDSHRSNFFGGESDLYISFTKSNNKFGEAINLGNIINGKGAEFGASLSPDGKYIFFTKNRDIYWVSSEILKSL